MEVFSPVPLHSPWSPMGYQVVEVTEKGRPVQAPIPPAPPEGRRRASQPPGAPLGYRVAQVGEEHLPPAPRAPEPLRLPRENPSQKNTSPVPLWGLLSAGGLLLTAFVTALLIPAQRFPAPPVPEVAFVDHLPQVNHFPQVNIPVAAAEDPPAIPPTPPVVQFPDAAAPPLEEKAQGPPAQCAEKPGKAGGMPAGRETFGTAVEFARNPLETFRLAEEERKLAFLLHVSGNFEDAGFT